MLPTALPVVLIGGWLGAGKTTLINHLLRHTDGRRIAVLVNDFGSTPIDADLIEAEGPTAGVISLAGGCLCCSYGDDLVGTLRRIAALEAPPDALLIELSGVALPTTVARTLTLVPAVRHLLTLVLADAGAIEQQMQDRYTGDTVRAQLAAADWLLLSKTDLVDAPSPPSPPLPISPHTRLLATRSEALWPELLLGWRDETALPARVPHAAAAGSFAALPMRRAAHPDFESHEAALPTGVDLLALGARLTDPARGVLRAKALWRSTDGLEQVLHVAAGRCHIEPAHFDGPGCIVLIGLRGRWSPRALLDGLPEAPPR